MMIVPDDLLLAFFRETSSRLLEIDPEAIVVAATKNSDGHSHLYLVDCRRCVLDLQRTVLKEVTERLQKKQQESININSNSDSTDSDNVISPTQVQERLGRLQHETNLSRELKTAMEDMNHAARVGVCKLILCNEEILERENNGNGIKDEDGKSKLTSTSSRNLQDGGRLERTKLMEYFGLCQTSLKLPCVFKFLTMTDGDLIFLKEKPTVDINCDGNDCNNNCEKQMSSSATMMFPQSRLEYTQRLLAKGMGWDPVFVTSELRKIFVEKPGDVDYGYYDNDVMIIFHQLVEQMTIAIQAATLQVRSKQDTNQLNDLNKGGNTRVLSVQYSEFEVDQNGTKIKSKNNAPEKSIDERQQQLTEEEQKRQLRLASDAAILQQSILGELLTMDEDERNHTLNEAAEAEGKFMEEVLALSTGQERIEFLRSVDTATSRQLAMHKLWNEMLQANGGKAPKLVPRK